jgi:hypothetical protein
MRATWFGALAFSFAAAWGNLAADDKKIAAEISRLSVDAPAVLPEDSRAPIMDRLERSRLSLAGGHIYLALYDLQPAFEAEAGYRLAAAEKVISTQDAFVRTWTEMGPPADPPAHKADVMFVEALAQSVEGRAAATYRASRPFAEDAGRAAGLYYLGESHAMVRFAALCRSLALQRPATAKPSPGSIEPHLAKFEAAVVKAYDGAPAEHRPRFAGVNVTIKLARTLDEQRRHEGALLQYLVSRYRYRLIDPAGKTAPPADELRNRLASTRFPDRLDHSIGEFFVQLGLAAQNGPEPSPQGAATILDDILPGYLQGVTR